MAELYWLAVPSPVSTYYVLKNKKANPLVAVVMGAISAGAFILPFLCVVLSFLGFTLLYVNSNTWFLLISIALIIIGRIFTFWGTINIRKHLKMKNMHVLKSGIFSISRHPIATGLVMSLIGLNLAYLHAFLFALSIIFVVHIHLKILKEEKLLLQQHPDDYKQYTQKIRRYL